MSLSYLGCLLHSHMQVAHEGVNRLQKMVQGGATLHPRDHPTVVHGQFEEDMGGGRHSVLCGNLEPLLWKRAQRATQ
jgi:hypothetical protein